MSLVILTDLPEKTKSIVFAAGSLLASYLGCCLPTEVFNLASLSVEQLATVDFHQVVLVLLRIGAKL